jgi:hypothetical protein
VDLLSSDIWISSIDWVQLSKCHLNTGRNRVSETLCVTNSETLVRKRTILTEGPPLVGEVNANLCGYRVSRGRETDPYGRILGFLDRVTHFVLEIKT